MRRGWTLIELLVVVSIIALLLSILVPALMGAVHESRAAACGSNLRQIGIAVEGYRLDYNQWPFLLTDVREYLADFDPRVVRCPEDRPGTTYQMWPLMWENVWTEEEARRKLVAAEKVNALTVVAHDIPSNDIKTRPHHNVLWTHHGVKRMR